MNLDGPNSFPGGLDAIDTPALRVMAPRLDGFSASSLYEARLARSVAGDGRSVHLTTPGLRGSETGEIGALCDYISLQDVSCPGLPEGCLGLPTLTASTPPPLPVPVEKIPLSPMGKD